jgi:hypothetical protein
MAYRTRGAEADLRTNAVSGLNSSVSLFFLDHACAHFCFMSSTSRCRKSANSSTEEPNAIPKRSSARLIASHGLSDRSIVCINGNQLAENSPNQMASVLLHGTSQGVVWLLRAKTLFAEAAHLERDRLWHVIRRGIVSPAADRRRRCGRPGWTATRRPKGVDGLVIILMR